MALDSILLLLGRGCPWFICWYLVINLLRASISAFSFNSFLWANAKPRSVHCHVPDGFFLNESVPFEQMDDGMKASKCLQYVNFSIINNKTVSCTNGYEYDIYVDNSITTEWNLVCENQYLSAFADSAFFTLSLIGSITSNSLADRFGRKPVFIGCVLVQTALGFISGFSPNVIFYIILRMLLGPLQQATYTIGYCFVLELFPLEWRATACLANEMFWPISGVILCGIVYFVRGWRMYHYVTTAPFVLSIVLFWVMPESIPWLIAKGRIEDAKNTLKAAARFSKNRAQILEILSSNTVNLGINLKETEKVSMPNGTAEPEIDNRDESDHADVAIYPCYYSCTQKYVRMSTLVNIFVWFTVGCAYYGVQVQAMRVGDPYINFILLTLIDVPAVLITVPLSRKIGRKPMLILGYCVLGPSIALVYITMRYLTSAVWLHIIISLIGKFMITLIYAVLFLHTSELYPTSLRSVGMAIGTSMGRMGTAITPFLVMMDNLYSWFPSCFLATFSVLSGILVAFLTETKTKPLPQTLQDIHQWHQNGKRWRRHGKSRKTKL